MTPGMPAPGCEPLPHRRRALLLVNGRGTRAASLSARDLQPGLKALAEAEIIAEPEILGDPGAIPARIRASGAEADMVLIGGGDGTFSCALDAILECGKPMGLLPLGNANDLARTLGIPTAIEAACRVVAAGYRQPVDVGNINGTHFFNVASIGLSVRIARRLTNQRKGRWGILAYLGCAWEAAHEQRSFRARITCDGETVDVRSMQIAVGNGRFYGGGMTIVDDARIDDGRLDLYALPHLRGWRLLVLLPILRWGWHRPVQNILSLHGREISVETDRILDINVDGEVRARTPARFRVVPRALDVFVPAPKAA